jgi:fibronectin-binding autotransporter adhesin
MKRAALFFTAAFLTIVDRKRSGAIVRVVVAGMFLLMLSTSASAINKFWIGAGAGNFNDGTRWSTTSGGANNTTAPGAADEARFDGGGLGDCTITASIAGVQSINIAAGYTGTITQNAGVTIAITGGVADFIQDGGTFAGGNSAITVADAFTLSGGAFTGGSGAITVTGAFTQTGGAFTSTSGTLTVVAAFSHTTGGTFTHNSGTVAFTGADSTLDAAVTTTFSNVNFNGAASGTNKTISGGFVVAGTLTLTNGTVETGTIEAQGNVTVASTFDGGTAALSFTGTGAQSFSFTAGILPSGDWTINKSSGTLTLLNSITLAAAQGVIITAGTLDLNGLAHTFGDLQGSGTITNGVAASITLTTGGSNASTTFSGVIQNPSGTVALTKTGAGTMTLSGANAYTGITTISAGTLSINTLQSVSGGASSLGAPTTIANGTIGIGATGILQYTGTGHASNRVINVTADGGSVDASGSGDLTLSGGVTGSGNNLVLTGTGTGSESGVIANGAGTLTKSGTGTWTLSGSNTYTGLTTISAGTLKLGATGGATNTPLGTTGTGTSVTAGAVLDLNGFTLGTAEPLTLNGTGISSGGALTNNSVTNVTYSGLLTLGSASSIVANSGTIGLTNIGTISGATFALTLDGSSGGSITSIIGNTTGGVVKNGSGTWTLSGVSTYTGTTTVNGGTLKAGVATQAFGSGSNVTLANTAGVVLDITGFNNTLGSLAGGGATGGNVTLGAATLTTGNATSTSYAGVISGTGAVTKAGTGSFTLSGANTYTGKTTISAGTLSINTLQDVSGGSSSLGAPITVGNGTIDISGTGILQYTGTGHSSNRVINLTASGGAVDASGSGTFTLNGGPTNSITAASFNLVLTGTGTGVVNGVIATGAGTLTKSGSGTWTLAGSNTYTGQTNINVGTLKLGATGGTTNTPLGTAAAGTVVASGAVLDLNGFTLANTVTFEALTLNGTGGGAGALTNSSVTNVTYSGLLALGSASTIVANNGTIGITNAGTILGNTFALTLDGSNGGSIASPINNGSGGVIKNGSGTWTLSGASLYTGATTVNGGTLKAGVATTAFGTGSNVTLANTAGVVLDITGFNNTLGSLAGGGTTGGNVTLGAATLTTGNTSSTSYAGVISGTGAVTKAGSGAWTVSGNNTYSGLTTINGGTYKLGAAGDGTNTPLGTIAAGTIVTGTTVAALDLNGFTLSTDEPLTLNGTGIALGGALTNSSGTVSYSGLITLGSDSSIIATSPGVILITNPGTITGAGFDLTLGGSGNGTLSSILGTVGGGLIKSGAGLWTLAAANTFTGGVTINNAGVLLLAADGALGTTNTLTFGASATGGLRLQSHHTTVTGLTTNAGSPFIENAFGIAATLTVNNAGAVTPTGLLLADGTGGAPLELKKDGAGTLTLAGLNTYTGITTILNGTLSINSLASVGGGSSALGAPIDVLHGTIGLGGTGILRYTGTGHTSDRVINLTASGGSIDASGTVAPLTLTGGVTGDTFNLVLTGTSPGAGVESGVIATTSGTVTKTGTGTWTLSGANTYTGATLVSAGVLNVQNAQGTGTTAGGVTVSSGAALQLQGGTTVGDEALSLGGTGITATGALRNISGANTWGGTVTLTAATSIQSDAGSLTLNAANSITGTQNLTLQGAAGGTISGTITTGTGTLTKAGAGTWTLSGLNTYTGITTISAGTLSINTLQDVSGGASSLGAPITVLNGTIFLGGGTLLYTGTGHSSNRAIDAADLSVIDASGSGPLTLSGGVVNGSFTLTGSGTGEESGAIATGGDSVTKNGSGTWTLSGANTFSAGTILNAGTLNINSTTALGTGTFTINGGTIDNTTGGSITLTNNNAQAWNGNFTFTGTQALDLGTGAVTLSANRQVTVSASTLTVGGGITGAGRTLTKEGAGTLVLNGVVATTSGTVTVNAGILTLAGTNTYTGGTTLSAGTLNINNTSALGTVAGTFTINGGTIDNTSAGNITTVNYPLALNGDFTYAGSVPRNLSLGTGATTISANRQITVTAGTFTIGGTISAATRNLTKAGVGTLSFGANPVTLNGLTISAGTLTSTSGTMSLAGDFTNGGAFTHNSGIVNFNGTVAQAIGGSASTAFSGLTIANTGTGTTMNTSGSVSGVLTLTSDLTVTSPAILTQSSTSAGAGDVVGAVRRTDVDATLRSFGNVNVKIANTGATQVDVSLVKGVAPGGFASAVLRSYSITPGAGAISATVQLRYIDPGELNGNAEGSLTLWRAVGSPSATWTDQGFTTRDGTNNWVQLTGITAFSNWTLAGGVSPTAANGSVSGQILDSNGNPVEGAVVRLSGRQNRKFITDRNGNYRFDNVETNGFYTVTPSRVNYTFSPSQRSFSQLGNNTDAAFTASATSGGLNPLDTPEYFVRQQYLDFLGREPDESGFNFWSDEILSCNRDAACVEVKRVNVSAAFFLSIEFQETGYLVYRMYQAAYGDMPGAPVPIRLGEFRPDTAEIGNGVVVLQGDWQARLESNKQAYIAEFVQRTRFTNLYANMSDGQFVDTLNHNAGFALSQSERDQLVSDLSTQAKTRAQVLRSVAENAALARQEFNQAFVLMEYFGYLQRDANTGPDTDFTGYNFWLDKLNSFGGNFQNAEMVKAFLVSGEYRGRFPR